MGTLVQYFEWLKEIISNSFLIDAGGNGPEGASHLLRKFPVDF